MRRYAKNEYHDIHEEASKRINFLPNPFNELLNMEHDMKTRSKK